MIKPISHFIGCEGEYSDSDIVLFGIPFDGTVSYRPGTRFAPAAIRNESYGIETYSPYLDKDLTDLKIFDAGDLDMPFGNTQKALDKIEKFVKKLMDDNKRPLMVGGEHLVSFPVIKSVFDKYPDLCVLHLDAHADVREDYSEEKFSHATVIKRVWELTGDDRIYQIGIRSGERYEFEWAKSHTNLHKFDCGVVKDIIPLLKNKPVYITLDLDILDPSVFPGTGTPEPGGITYKELLDTVVRFNELNIVGADVMELSPHYDQSGTSTICACKIIREMLLAMAKH